MAIIFQGNGGVFAPEDFRVYWRTLLAVFSPQGSLSELYRGNTNVMITLMISTTLIPTLLHFGLVLLNVVYTSLGSTLKLLALLFTGNARFFASAMSVVILLIAYVLVHFLVINLGL
jgi:hypothetical protein